MQVSIPCPTLLSQTSPPDDFRALAWLALSPASFIIYKRIYTHWYRYVLLTKMDVATARAVDRAIANWVYDVIYKDEQPSSYAFTIISAVSAFVPHMQYVVKPFALAARTIAGLRVTRKPSSKIPLSWPMAHFFAFSLQKMVGLGYANVDLIILLSHHCLLRANEALALQKRDIVFSTDVHTGAALVLHSTKTGDNQMVTISNPFLVSLLRKRLVHLRDGDRLTPVPYARYCKAFHAVKVGHTFTPHCLRHGGATAAALAGASLDSIMERGRWLCATSARRYIKAGKTILLKTQLPPKVTEAAKYMADNPHEFFA